MMEFSHVKYGVLVAMVAILFGGSLGLSFGCCEDDIKGVLKGSAEKELSGVYGDDQAKADKVVKKSWVYRSVPICIRRPWVSSVSRFRCWWLG